MNKKRKWSRAIYRIFFWNEENFARQKKNKVEIWLDFSLRTIINDFKFPKSECLVGFRSINKHKQEEKKIEPILVLIFLSAMKQILIVAPNVIFTFFFHWNKKKILSDEKMNLEQVSQWNFSATLNFKWNQLFKSIDVENWSREKTSSFSCSLRKLHFDWANLFKTMENYSIKKWFEGFAEKDVFSWFWLNNEFELSSFVEN